MSTNLDFVRDTIFQLKEEYPLELDVYRVASSSVNTETGKQTTVRTVRRVSQAIILPSALLRIFTYDLAFISANKNFTLGGFYDVNNRTVLIDRDDLDIDLRLDDYFVIRGCKYQVIQVELLEELATYMVAIRELKGSPLYEIFDGTVTSILGLTSKVEVKVAVGNPLEVRANSKLDFSDEVGGELEP